MQRDPVTTSEDKVPHWWTSPTLLASLTRSGQAHLVDKIGERHQLEFLHPQPIDCQRFQRVWPELRQKLGRAPVHILPRNRG